MSSSEPPPPLADRKQALHSKYLETGDSLVVTGPADVRAAVPVRTFVDREM